jgi:hypothetical protein
MFAKLSTSRAFAKLPKYWTKSILATLPKDWTKRLLAALPKDWTDYHFKEANECIPAI